MINSHLFQQLVNFSHYFYVKFKHVYPIIFFLIIFLPWFSQDIALGQKVVGTVRTPLTIKVDWQEKHFVATQNTVGGALTQDGISLGEYDVTNPPADTYLTGKPIKIEVIRALPVLISDNNQEYLAYSAYTNEFDILKQLKIEIYPEDKVSSELILDPADENAIGQKVIIMRAPIYKIFVDGGIKIVRSWSKDVKEVIAKSGIQMGPQDQVTPTYGSVLIMG